MIFLTSNERKMQVVSEQGRQAFRFKTTMPEEYKDNVMLSTAWKEGYKQEQLDEEAYYDPDGYF